MDFDGVLWRGEFSLAIFVFTKLKLYICEKD